MRVAAIAVVVLLAAGLVLIVGIAQLTDKGAPNRETDQSVEVVLNDLDKVQGKRVAVVGDVKTSLAPWAVLLGSSDATQVGLLVVTRKPIPKGVKQTTHVNALGVAKPFSLAAFRRAHPLNRSALRELNGQPALTDASVVVQAP